MEIYLPGVSRRGCRGWAPRHGAAVPRRGAPRRRRRRRGGRRPSRRPASASGCRGAARGRSWRSRSGGTAGEGKGHRGPGASPTSRSPPVPGAPRRWVSPSAGSLGCPQALCLHSGARGARWQLAPTAGTLSGWTPDGAFTGRPAAESIPRGTTRDPAGTWTPPAHGHPRAHPTAQPTTPRLGEQGHPPKKAPSGSSRTQPRTPNPWGPSSSRRPGRDQMQGRPSLTCSCSRQG